MNRPKKIAEKNLLGNHTITDFGRIHVLRHEKDGKRLLGVATAEDLSSPAAFQARFGGGSYTLMARTPDNRRLAARIRFDIDGEMKPTTPSPPIRRHTPSSAPAASFPFETATGRLARAVFACFRAGRTTEDIVDELAIDPSTIRRLFHDWITDHTEAPPTTREEMESRVQLRRTRARLRWNDQLNRGA